MYMHTPPTHPPTHTEKQVHMCIHQLRINQETDTLAHTSNNILKELLPPHFTLMHNMMGRKDDPEHYTVISAKQECH